VLKALKDPNIVYLIMLFGLWLSVTAAYVPGTGVLEAVAMGALIVAVLFLTVMPTNWVAALLIILGVMGFLVMPFLKKRLAPLAIGGLILQAIGSVFLFRDQAVSPLLIVFTIGGSLAYYLFVLTPILKTQPQKAAVSEDDLLIGAYGRVVRPLEPNGTVYVRGETWQASSDRPLPAGEAVVIVEREGLQLFVEPAKLKRRAGDGQTPEELAELANESEEKQ
jgi:membrane-bound serine protease (ClpP class)